MFRSNVSQWNRGFRAGGARAEKKKEKNGGRIATTIQPRYFVRRVTRNTKKRKNLARLATTHDASNARRAIFYSPFHPSSLYEKQQRHDENIFRKIATLLAAKDLFFPRADFNPTRNSERGYLERTHHYVKDATSLVLRRPTRAFLHSRATSPMDSRQLALSTNS